MAVKSSSEYFNVIVPSADNNQLHRRPQPAALSSVDGEQYSLSVKIGLNIPMNNSAKWKRIILLSMFWFPYLFVPWFTGWSFASNVQCTWCWDEILHHAFAIFGYGIFGCIFYALTAKRREHESFDNKFWQAMGINFSFLAMSVLIIPNWGIVLL